MAEGNAFPPEFADLERFRDWALPTEAERLRRRTERPDDELRALYEAMLPRMDDVVRHLNAFPLDGLPDDVRRLYDLAKSMMEISIPVERGRSAVAWRFDVFRFRAMHERPA
jgi:hypothetical protein